ncbi:MAG: hypothetical protein R3301_11555 [Saprospiraceae bacterium]|nr:hypothetical protein [Saprospiraceae bacterium]
MKPMLLAIVIAALFALDAKAQEYAILTSVESIIPAGIGRSRIIAAKDVVDPNAITRARTDGKRSDINEVTRRELKADEFEETKLLNFYSVGGINFRNIASNDAIISAKLTQMAQNGWELIFVTSGVESDGGEVDGNGIFVTRYIFKRD